MWVRLRRGVSLQVIEPPSSQKKKERTADLSSQKRRDKSKDSPSSSEGAWCIYVILFKDRQYACPHVCAKPQESLHWPRLKPIESHSPFKGLLFTYLKQCTFIYCLQQLAGRRVYFICFCSWIYVVFLWLWNKGHAHIRCKHSGMYYCFVKSCLLVVLLVLVPVPRSEWLTRLKYVTEQRSKRHTTMVAHSLKWAVYRQAHCGFMDFCMNLRKKSSDLLGNWWCVISCFSKMKDTLGG